MKKKIKFWVIAFTLALLFIVLKDLYLGRMYSSGLRWSKIIEEIHLSILYAIFAATLGLKAYYYNEKK